MIRSGWPQSYTHLNKGVLPLIAVQLRFLMILAVLGIATWLPRQLF